LTAVCRVGQASDRPVATLASLWVLDASPAAMNVSNIAELREVREGSGAIVLYKIPSVIAGENKLSPEPRITCARAVSRSKFCTTVNASN
jgi:hypothetical protein